MGVGALADVDLDQSSSPVDEPGAGVEQARLGQSAEHIEKLEPGVYGMRPVEPARLGDLIMFKQIRAGVNSIQDPLTDSIRQTELLNNPNIASSSYDLLVSYAGLNNYLWGGSYDADSYDPDDEGRYKIVAAGHSRFNSIWKIERAKAKRARALGIEFNPADAIVGVKYHHCESPQDIISIQVQENIHSTPAPERRAIALVEGYYWGKKEGLWRDTAEYVQHWQSTGFGIPMPVIEEALYFVGLPEEVRAFTFSGGIPYEGAVALGKNLDLVRFYFSFKLLHKDPRDLSEVEATEVESATNQWAFQQLAEAYQKKWTARQITRNFNARTAAMNEKLAIVEDPQMVMAEPILRIRDYRRGQQRKVEDLARSLGEEPMTRAAELLSTLYELTGDQSPIIRQEVSDRLMRFGARLIEAAASDAEEEPAGLF